MTNIETMTQDTAYLIAALIFVIGVISGGIFASRPWRYLRVFRNFFRLLTTPLRRIGVLGKSARRIKGARNAAVTSRASISVLERKTEIEKAIFLQRHGLFHPGEDIELDEDRARELEKQSKEVEKAYIVRSNNLLFNEIEIPSSYTPDWMKAGLTEETVADFRQNADAFFNGQVDLTAEKNSLYEEIDGMHAIYMFGNPNADLAAYNLINEARKNINTNAFRLILSFLFSVLVSIGLVVFVFEHSVWSFVTLGVGILFMCFLQFAYRNKQEHSIRALGKFMTLYVGYLSDRFRDVNGQALGVTVGNEKDPDVLSENAMIWNKLMVWIAFRTFFIETFLRNQMYQINRNSGYYKLFSDVLVFALIPLLIYAGHAFGLYDLRIYIADLYGRAIAGGALLIGLAYFVLIRIPVITEELDRQEWRGFDKLNLGEKMDEVVGKYASEIGYWKQRLER
ncbi:MAG: hypothetical protein AAGD92_09255 [Pseudomonadota bacterium]